MPKNKLQNNDERLISLFFNMGRNMRHHSPKHDPMSLLKFETLRYVAEAKRIQMKEIANLLSITAPSATSLINGLVKTGALKRVHNDNDRRSVYLEITAEGKKFVEQGRKQLFTSVACCLNSLTSKEKESLITILEKILKTNC